MFLMMFQNKRLKTHVMHLNPFLKGKLNTLNSKLNVVQNYLFTMIILN